MAHIHLGAGALGLGLVCAASVSANLELIVLNRRSADSLDRCDLLLQNKCFNLRNTKTRHIERFDIKSFGYLGEPNELVAEALAADEPLLITTALKKDGVAACLQELVTLIKHRLIGQPNKPLIVIAAENAIDTHKLQSDVEAKLDPFTLKNLKKVGEFLPCVVDRICNKPLAKNGQVEVDCENYWNWIIEKPYKIDSFDFLVEKFSNLPEVDFVENIEPYKMRKAIIVNGLHLTTAMFAHFAEEVRIDHFITKDAFGQEIFASLAEEILELFYHWNASFASSPFHEHELQDFMLEVRDRLMSHPHSTTDAVKRFKLDKLVEFFDDYDRKVGTHYINYGRQMRAYGWLPLSPFAISELIAGEKWI